MSITSNTRHAIPATSPEKDRLANQHAMKKSAYGWTTPVPTIIDLAEIQNILDIPSAPQIKSRRQDVTIYGCDINTAIFPPASLTDDTGVQTFVQDVTKPFAPQYHGKFDLVHISLLVLCLTGDGWRTALANVHTLLTPGGRVIVDELDPVLFKEGEYPRPEEGGSYDLDKSMAGTAWINKLNCLYTGFILRNHFVIGLSVRLGGMLEQAGFKTESTELGTGGVGPLCRALKGLDGGSLAAYEEFSVENTMFMVDQFVAIMLKTGALEVPPGHRVSDEDEIKTIVEEVRKGLKTEGALGVVSCFVGKKL
ncbi:hypothetical protein DFH09DRAFT_1275212 [Mycena vulgaris]|nr:hypothetical protein DFH09DRAFT_1275212 [Mycena vulgaris]